MANNQLTSHDSDGILVNKRTQAMFLYMDPLGIGKPVRWDFELDLLDEFETESTYEVMFNGSIHDSGSCYNDYYGHGRSIQGAVEEAMVKSEALSGSKMDVLVKTTLKGRPCFLSGEEAFYNNSIRVFYCPFGWFISSDNDDTPETRQSVNSIEDREFIVWKNGEYTEEYNELINILKDLVSSDVMNDKRRTMRKSIFTEDTGD